MTIDSLHHFREVRLLFQASLPKISAWEFLRGENLAAFMKDHMPFVQYLPGFHKTHERR